MSKSKSKHVKASFFEFTESSDDEQDFTKPKRTGNVMRVYDPEHKTFRRLRNKQLTKKSKAPNAPNSSQSEDVTERGVTETGDNQKRVVVAPMDKEEERLIRMKLKKELAQRYKFIDDMREEEEESGFDSLKKYRINEELRLSSQRESLSPVATPPEIQMTPITRFSRKEKEKKPSKRKRSEDDDGDEFNLKTRKKSRGSTSSEDSAIYDTPENAIANGRFGRFKGKHNTQKTSNIDGTPKNSWKKGGGGPNPKFNKKMKTPTQKSRYGMKTATPKFNKWMKGGGTPNFKNKKCSASNSKRVTKKSPTEKEEEKSQSTSRSSQGYVSQCDQTPEFMKVKDEDSVKQEKKDRRRRRNMAMNMRTKRGQPVMKGRIELMLEKIKSDLNVPS